MLTGRNPDLNNMHIIGTVCYAYIQNCKKLDAHCEKGVFVGNDGQSSAYLVYFPDKEEVRKVRCVRFTNKYEAEMPKPVIYETDSDSDMTCSPKPQDHQPTEKYPDQTKNKND